MKGIKTGSRILTKTAEGTREVGDAQLTVKGKRKPWAVTYDVLIDSEGKNIFKANGSFMRVVMAMEKDDHAKEGLRLLKEVAEAVSDPKRSLTDNFDDGQLSCLAALVERDMTLAEVADAAQLITTQATKALVDMQFLGLVCRCEEEGEPVRKYSLTEAGGRMAELLREEEKFRGIRKNLKRKKKETKPEGMYLNEEELLCICLLEGGTYTTKNIAEIMDMRQSQILKMLKALEGWGVVTKAEKISDRNWRYSITPTGKRHIEALMEDDRFLAVREKVKEYLKKPTVTVSKFFSEKELLCLAALEKGPRNIAEVAGAAGLDEEETGELLKWLESGGILCQGEGKYAIDRKGRQYMESLRRDENFLELRKKVKGEP